MIYRGFPSRLHHGIPHWVEPGAPFHIRIRLNWQNQQRYLTDPDFAPLLLESARFYQEKQRWHIIIFLLMPDHLHAVLSFACDQSMSDVVSDWKRYQMTQHHVDWQEGYFDHRMRDDERGEQVSSKVNYIRQNPVAAGLCTRAEDWPWASMPRDDL